MFGALKVLKNLFRSRQTDPGFSREFPKERMGRVVYDEKKCIKCYECVRNCPAVAISVRPDKFVQVDDEKCIRCGLCVRKCPTRALKMKEK
ncbi:MAG TPA: 4Fe-4S dicluster domain-containing protein [archaeon]|nr:4Fe-4S dicluster domain-containing protein [archaeon]